MTATVKPAPPLGYYLDLPVVGATIQITNTGAGLDKGLAMPAIALDPGTYDVVLRCRLVEHRHEVDSDLDEVQLVNRLKAEHATIVDAGEVASEALDRAEARVAERRSEAERRKREEAGELPLFDGNGDGRGGDPQTVGSILDDAIDLAAGAARDADWRSNRTKALDALGKPSLLESAAIYGVSGRSSMTKAELVDAIVDFEEQGGHDADSVPF